MRIHQLRMTDFDRDFGELKISHIREPYFSSNLSLWSAGKGSRLTVLPVSSSLIEIVDLAGAIAALAARGAGVGAMVFLDSDEVTGVVEG